MFEIEIDDFIGSDFWEVGITARFVKNELKKAKGQSVQFNINSPGGYVTEGLAIFNVIKNYEGKKKAVITGLTASMASIIPLACDEVVAENNAIYMIHNPLNLAIGDYQVMRENADFLERMAVHLGIEYVGKTGKNESEIKSWMDAESWFFGKEILDAGFIDTLLPPKNQNKNKSKTGATAALPGMEIQGDNSSNRESVLINAQAQFENMKKELAKQTINIEDIREAAAMLPTAKKDIGNNKENNLTPQTDIDNINEIENNVEEKKIMNLEELKAQHPELVAQIEKDASDAATTNERKRVSAHLKFIESSQDSVIKNITEGVSFQDEEVIATYTQAQIKKGIVKNAEEENPDNVDTDPEAAPETEPEKKDEEPDPMENDSDENVDAFLNGGDIKAKTDKKV